MSLDAKIGLLLGLVFLIIVGFIIQPDRHYFIDDSYEVYHNNRYNFSFHCPKDWVADPPPQNGDGMTFRNPENPSIEITGYGSIVPVADFPIPRVDEIEKCNSDDPGYKLLSKHNLEVALWKSNSADLTQLQQTGTVTAYRVVFVTEKDGGSIAIMRQAIEHDGIEYHLYCEAPSEMYEEYKKIFLDVCGSFKVWVE